ncbi:interactor protein for cytohesin exchange factors 1-like [Sander lucioperca]|uniref:Interactor protein for cytohesin exchange factors 1-like n=1 Tax=Sander lucioperca TaxID=283035 RepID=A0A8C9Z2B3_SANLU|nr:interactor protein for cytohesin exchange factors 1-like [Sander lucioperca]
MSRRRISVKDLGVLDCQGWLLRRKGGRSFLGSKWKRYWFVLKKSSLYWYTNEMAEKAEGFINLSGFTIQQATQCRKKHAMTASHPLVVTIFIAAESFTDMNKWISKLSEAAEPCELINAEECYSEGSDQDADECAATSCSLNCEQETVDSENGDVPQPLGESSPCTSTPPASPTGENRRRSTLEGGTLSRNRRGRRRVSSEGGERLSLLDPAGPDGASLPLIHVGGTEDEDVHEKPADEMECLYNDLKAASLSPIGQSSRRDFRASFVRRCQNDKVNEKLHLLRILQSTLKAKESELLALEQILTAPTLAAATYRKWRLSNAVMVQEIAQRNQAAGGAAELR